ncbi:MAG: hypothetical protein QG657_2212 [Acidobacteriota bacterium]|nr:hypothetical protein [Acidobacteriota bacterium]
MLVSRKDSLAKLRDELSKYGRFYIYELEYFKDHREGIYVISADILPPAGPADASRAKLL